MQRTALPRLHTDERYLPSAIRENRQFPAHVPPSLPLSQKWGPVQNHAIEQLYGMESGSYNLLFGSVELSKPEGAPKVFVIAGGGCGIPVYRALQKRWIPFATGILFDNDVDFQVAQVLASSVVSTPAFEEITDGQYQQAAKLLLKCASVVDAGTPIGTRNLKNQQLLQLAREEKLPIYPVAKG